MFRIALLLLALTGSVQAANPAIETINEFESVMEAGGARITVDIRDRVLREKKTMLLDWVSYSVDTVIRYYGRFPVDQVTISLQVTGGQAVRFGQAFGGDSPFVRVVVGENVDRAALRRDWIMVHELVHLAMADVPEAHRWWLEGLATYVESIARARRGHLTETFVWNGFYHRMPQGQPQAGDRGLDRTPTWGRTYWGGAMFCLLADIEIRKQTNNRKSLQDALIGILDAGYSMHASTSAIRVFEAADRAIGVDVLVPQYERMRHAPSPVDLDQLWRDLGITVENDQIVYDDDAPMAHIRRAMLRI